MSRTGSSTALAIALCAVSLTLLHAGCTFAIRPTPAPNVDASQIELGAGLHLGAEGGTKTHTTTGLCLIGAAHAWEVFTDEALRAAAEGTFRRMFRKVEHVDDPSGLLNTDLALLISLGVEQFEIDQGLGAQLRLHCRVVDRRDSVLYERTIPATGESQAAAGCLLGVTVGEDALQETSTDAFNKAFEALAEDIIKSVDFSPYLE